MPDSLDVDKLAKAYRASLAARPGGAPHPSDDQWERLAAGAMSDAERASIGDHVVDCGECLAVYQVVREVATRAAMLDPGAVSEPEAAAPAVVSATATPSAVPGSSPSWWQGLATAAAVVATLGTGWWAWTLRADVERLESLVADMRPAADVARLENAAQKLEAQVGALASDLALARDAGVNVPVVDLVRDQTRGGRAEGATADVPAGSRFVTLVVMLDGVAARSLPVTIEIARDDGSAVGRWPGARPDAYGAMSMVVPTALLPAGHYTVRALAVDGPVVRAFPLLVRQAPTP